MRMLVTVACLFAVLAGCGKAIQKEGPALVKVNNYVITRVEFEEAFKESPYGRDDAPESRKAFLGQLIDQKLILQDACSQGLDKDPGFLKMIERFWEQSLLRIVLDKQTQTIVGSVAVSDAEVRALYERLRSEGRLDKQFSEVEAQLRRTVEKQKAGEALNNWLSGLRQKAEITINDESLR